MRPPIRSVLNSSLQTWSFCIPGNARSKPVTTRSPPQRTMMKELKQRTRPHPKSGCDSVNRREAGLFPVRSNGQPYRLCCALGWPTEKKDCSPIPLHSFPSESRRQSFRPQRLFRQASRPSLSEKLRHCSSTEDPAAPRHMKALALPNASHWIRHFHSIDLRFSTPRTEPTSKGNTHKLSRIIDACHAFLILGLCNC